MIPRGAGYEPCVHQGCVLDFDYRLVPENRLVILLIMLCWEGLGNARVLGAGSLLVLFDLVGQPFSFAGGRFL
jgi:hypothetical protein